MSPVKIAHPSDWCVMTSHSGDTYHFLDMHPMTAVLISSCDCTVEGLDGQQQTCHHQHQRVLELDLQVWQSCTTKHITGKHTMFTGKSNKRVII